MTSLTTPLTLPCGAVLKNRLAKSAMSEILGSREHDATPRLERLYRRWAAGGSGLLVTGNVMIDRRALGEPGNVVVEDERGLDALEAWAAAGTEGGTACWMQLNHPGKQSPFFLSPEPVAPSPIPLGRGLEKSFRPPRALTGEEIQDLVRRFATAAGIARRAGFTGVQIHGAHGYLVSQFLSPRHNQRDDAWGGSPEKRRRFALEVIRAIRTEVGDDFPVGIKINSADFTRGGLGEDEALDVVRALAAAGLDLIEISGGSYESPVMMTGGNGGQDGHGSNGARRASTVAREAYFLEFAQQARAAVDVPIAVTGGFRSARGLRDAVASGAVDVAGLARPLAVDPDFARRVLDDADAVSPVRQLSTGVRFLDQLAFINITWYERQLARMGAGKAPNPNMSPLLSVLATLADSGWSQFRRRRA